jgi:hypothetical protein
MIGSLLGLVLCVVFSTIEGPVKRFFERCGERERRAWQEHELNLERCGRKKNGRWVEETEKG